VLAFLAGGVHYARRCVGVFLKLKQRFQNRNYDLDLGVLFVKKERKKGAVMPVTAEISGQDISNP
jgi:hypothetical protein